MATHSNIVESGPPPGSSPDIGNAGGDDLAARRAALDLLQAVLRHKRPLDEALANNSELTALDSRDRGFARNMVSTALRRLGQIDALINHFLDSPLPQRAAGVRDILRLGICQLIFIGTPPHAAVDKSVALCEAVGLGRFKGLVNAILRRVAKEGPALVRRQDAERFNTPDWLWNAWQKSFGEETCRLIARAHLEEAPLDISVKKDHRVWAERLKASPLPTGTLRRAPGGPVTGLTGFDEGAWWIQDAASALPVRLFGDVAGRQVVDLCAAPGGKTAQLAAAGAEVIAIDRSAARLRRLTENLDRLGLHAETLPSDATLWHPQGKAEMVLLDAPCTSTGTIRRHPDIGHLKTPDDVTRLADVQARLMDAAANMLAPGGILVYSVCSLQREEGIDQVTRAIAAHGLERVPVQAGEIGDLDEFLTAEGDLRTLPSHLKAFGGIDGFYAARLRRP